MRFWRWRRRVAILVYFLPIKYRGASLMGAWTATATNNPKDYLVGMLRQLGVVWKFRI